MEVGGHFKNEAWPDLRTGVWRHWKGGLYQVLGYSHNASDEGRPQVLYISLYTDREKPGPRFATRDVEEFFDAVCQMHGMEWHGEEHARVTVSDRERMGKHFEETKHQSPENSVFRFEYLGPVYYAGMERS